MHNTRYIPLEPINYKATFTHNFDSLKSVDAFLNDVYTYYYYKGFYNLLITEIFNLLSMFFMLWVTIILATGIDYTELFTTYHIWESLKTPHVTPLLGIFISIYSIYWSYRAYNLVYISRKMYQVREFYLTQLGITDQEIYTVKWTEIMKYLVDNLGGELNEHDIVNCVMRKQNFMIGIINKDIINLVYKFPFIGRVSLLTRLLEYNLKKILYPIIYGNNQCELNSDLLQRSKRPKLIRQLRHQLQLAAVINLLLAPFLLVVLALYFVFNYTQIFKSSPSSMCSYQWSLNAVWKFREFNELPHTLDYRLKKSYNAAEKYLTYFPFYHRNAVAKFICFVVGTFITVLTLFTLVDDQFLFHGVVFGEFSIVFTLGLLGSIYTLFQYFSISENVVNEPEEHMKHVVDWTHYYPKAWRQKVHHYTIRNEFNAFFEFKLTFICNEILSVLTTPFILWFVLAPKSDKIIDFFQDFIVKSPRVGYICSFATFDLQKHGSADYGNGVTEDAQSFMSDYLVSNNGKMEKSIMSFQKEYPGWNPAQSTRSWMQQMPGDSIFELECKFGSSHA